MSDDLTQEQIEQITAEIKAGRKISAIKIYREATGKGLKEAKDFIEAITVRLPREAPEHSGANQGSGCVGMFIIAIGLLGIVAWLSRIA